MKSRVVSKIPKMLLTYGIVSTKLESLLKIAQSESIIVRQVMPSELDIKVSQLLKVSQLKFEEYPQGTQECLVMVGFEKSYLNKFLSILRSKNLDIPIKATLTPTNQTWSFKHLLEELSKEHEQLSKK